MHQASLGAANTIITSCFRDGGFTMLFAMKLWDNTSPSAICSPVDEFVKPNFY
jgi:hypothetical protein